MFYLLKRSSNKSSHCQQSITFFSFSYRFQLMFWRHFLIRSFYVIKSKLFQKKNILYFLPKYIQLLDQWKALISSLYLHWKNSWEVVYQEILIWWPAGKERPERKELISNFILFLYNFIFWEEEVFFKLSQNGFFQVHLSDLLKNKLIFLFLLLIKHN